MTLLRYVLLSSGAAVLLLVAGHSWSEWTGTGPADLYVLTTSVLWLLTVGLFWILNRVSDPQVFVTVFLFTLGLKMLFYLCYLFVQVLASPAALWSNVVFSFMCYLVFTIVETTVLFQVKNNS